MDALLSDIFPLDSLRSFGRELWTDNSCHHLSKGILFLAENCSICKNSGSELFYPPSLSISSKNQAAEKDYMEEAHLWAEKVIALH